MTHIAGVFVPRLRCHLKPYLKRHKAPKPPMS